MLTIDRKQCEILSKFLIPLFRFFNCNSDSLEVADDKFLQRLNSLEMKIHGETLIKSFSRKKVHSSVFRAAEIETIQLNGV